MTTIPKEQASPHGPVSSGRRRSPQAPSASATIHQRHGDRGVPDEDVRRQLRRYVRHKDLVEAGIIGNWPTLLRFIEDEGFPTGIMIGPNTRAWPLDEVEAWLANRPTARKDVPLPRKQRGPQRAEVAETDCLANLPAVEPKPAGRES